MKKLILTLFVAVIAAFSASAQYNSAPEVFANNPEKVVPGMKYSKLKKLYDPQNAVFLSDPAYGTGRAWLNLFVPGLAQYTMGEVGLGTRYLLLDMLGGAAMRVGADGILRAQGEDVEPAIKNDKTPYYTLAAGGVILVANLVCSISNAKKVARVKSQYAYDLKKLGRQVSFVTVPYVAPVVIGGEVQPSAGMTLAVQF